jgi:hypothetical protein
VPEALVVTQAAVPPQPQNDPVETGLMVSDTVTLEELEACEAEFEADEPEMAAASEPFTAASESPSEAFSVDTVAIETATAAAPEPPAAQSIAADALLTEPADFLLQPLPDDEMRDDTAEDADESVLIKVELDIEEKPLVPLRLDSFDPLAPLRALSDEEKIALFS